MRSFLAVAASMAALAAAQDSSAVSSSQYWHERYHGLLSMAAYGDYKTECPKTFTTASLAKSFPDSTAAPWTVVNEWGPTASGLEGFNVIIPEMNKVVMVFKGLYGWEQLDNSPASLSPFGIDPSRCGANCTVHAGALQAYLEAKEATNDWADMKAAVEQTQAQWSVTGHAFGGMVAQVAALDLGWRNLCHWSHSHGAARVFSPAAADLYDQLFEGQAGQRTVANDDSGPTVIPESDDYTFTLQGFHIWGTNATYGMNYYICNTPTDPECLGGNNITDSAYYYTPIGTCGTPYMGYDEPLQDSFLSSESAAFYATATSTFNPAALTSGIANATSSAVVSSAVSSVVTSSAIVSSTASAVTTTVSSAPVTETSMVVATIAQKSPAQAAASTSSHSSPTSTTRVALVLLSSVAGAAMLTL